MEEKIRRATETGSLYVKIDEIFPGIIIAVVRCEKCRTVG